MRALYAQFYLRGKGFAPDDVRRTVSAVAGRDYADFFRRYVRGVDVPPYDTIFGYAGCELDSVGYLGIFGQQSLTGYRIGGMVPGGAAALAGLRRGDVLVSADGTAITLRAAGAGAGSPGQKINYAVLRDGKELQITVTLATRRVLRLRSDSSATADQLVVRRRWLARPAPGAGPR